ncbi:DUF55-domain-containing protein [Aaosphaeria arxii CBS 175.79]|uniref:Thymocyte nuclear protein 1 n=1 Tax=Aaosphaeria arxii CBS 175.79 TaxID=1450172 RepID=A0A6A5XSL6_9PLEO|nr:DUF55-domain-containing protein [Aaosphaeria arxii CBS 175.79]KAF2015244.1 DUF55-domain-containing protein [Aaosphaeria arxii CBS 175.79]
MPVTRRSARNATNGTNVSAQKREVLAKEKSTTTTAKATRTKRVRDEEETPPSGNVTNDSSTSVQSSKDPTATGPSASKRAKGSKAATAASGTANLQSNRDENGNQEVFWLLKAEPLPRYENGVNVAFSIDDLKNCTEPEPWSGVRNPQARNNMQAMRKNDLGFFYHSNAKPSGVVGILRVVEEAKVDESAFDPKDPYYDAKSNRDNPKWYCVGVEFVKKFDDVVDLHKIKSHATSGGALEKMQLVTNSRLSVSRVSKTEWDFIMDMAEGKGDKETS